MYGEIDNPMIESFRRLGLNVYPGDPGPPIEPAQERRTVRITIEVAAPSNPANPAIEQDIHDDRLRLRITREWIEAAIARNEYDVFGVEVDE